MPILSLQSPPGVKILSIVGADQDNDYLSVFAIGSDGNLWGRTFFASQWFPWASLGHPANGALSNSGNDLGRSVLASGKGAWWIFCVNAVGTVSVAFKATRESTSWIWMEIPGCPTDKKIASVYGAMIEKQPNDVPPILFVDYASVPEQYGMTYYANSSWDSAGQEWKWQYWSTDLRTGGFDSQKNTMGIIAGTVGFQLMEDGTIAALAAL